MNMLELIQHRGHDASGIAVFGTSGEGLLRVSLKNELLIDDLRRIVGEFGKMTDERIIEARNSIPIAEIKARLPEDAVRPLHEAINRRHGLCVHSIGNGMRVYKENGNIENLLAKHSIDKSPCRHAIGHVRMATESAEDVNAAHPFISPFYPGLSIVHNGQFTNYFNLRRFLEAKGAIFKTLNDSEAASHLIAYAARESKGDLYEALRWSEERMDGIYCVIAATESQIGFAKDPLGIKPLLLAETDEAVLLGSEQIEFSAAGNGIFAAEMAPGEVRVWDV